MTSLSIAAPSSVTFLSKSSSCSSSYHGVWISHLCPMHKPPSSSYAHGSYSPTSSVVMMAKREEELKEIRGKSTDELNEEIIDIKGELFMLHLQRSARNEYKSSEFHRLHKRIARMLAVKRKREIEERN